MHLVFLWIPPQFCGESKLHLNQKNMFTQKLFVIKEGERRDTSDRVQKFYI
jgi:hypothetical protein